MARRKLPKAVPMDAEDRETQAQRLFADMLLRDAVATNGQRELEARLDEAVAAARGVMIAAVGEPGAGKATFLARWAQKLRAAGVGNRMVLDYAVGATRHSLHVATMLRVLYERLAWHEDSNCKHMPYSEEGLIAGFPERLERAAQSGPIVLIVTHVMDLMAEDGSAAGLKWLPKHLPEGVTVVLALSMPDKALASSVKAGRVDPAFLTQLDVGLAGVEEAKAATSDATSSEGLPSPVAQGSAVEQAKAVRRQHLDTVCGHVLAWRCEMWRFSGVIGRSAREMVIEFLGGKEATLAPDSGDGLRPVAGPDESEPASDESNPVHLLASQVDAISAKFEKVRCLGFLADVLRAVRAAAQAGFDVHGLLREALHESVETREELASRLIQFFARGNYPLPTTVRSAWEACKGSALEGAAPALLKSRRLPSKREATRRQEIKALLGGESVTYALEDSDEDDEYADEDDDFHSDDEGEKDGNEKSATPETAEARPEAATNESLDAFPIYLLGGHKVEPLGDLFLQALGLLGSARYGLNRSELRKALARMQDPRVRAAAAREPEQEPDTNDLDASRLQLADDSFEEWLLKDSAVLSPGAEAARTAQDFDEEALVPAEQFDAVCAVLPTFARLDLAGLMCIPPCERALQAVIAGLIADDDVAPCEEEAAKALAMLESSLEEECAAAVPRPDTANTENGRSPVDKPAKGQVTDACAAEPAAPAALSLSRACRWRVILAAVFMQGKLTTRQCEELPWLLQSTAQWPVLAAYLLKIDTMSLMWSEQHVYRNDLISYWRRLACTSKASEAGPSETSAHIRHAILEGSSCDSAGSDDAARHPGAKYDPVDLYAQAVDRYQDSLSPNLGRITADEARAIMKHAASVMILLGEFFWAFGEFEHLAPLYLHPPVSERELEVIKVDLPHWDKARLGEEQRTGLVLDLEATEAHLHELNRQREEMIQQQHLAQRQVAVSQVKDESEKAALHSLKHRQTKYLGMMIEQHKQMAEKSFAVRVAGGVHFSGNRTGENFYSYQRWVWLQFPLMALFHASTVRIMSNRDRSRTVAVPRMRSKSRKRHAPQDRRVQTVVVVKGQSSRDGFWSRKKQSPSQPRQGRSQLSSGRLLTSSTEAFLPPADSGSSPAREEPDHTASAPSLRSLREKSMRDRPEGDPRLLQRGVGPFLHEASELPPNTVPFSSPSNRTLKHKTRFPTFKAMKRSTEGELLNIFHGGVLTDETIRDTFKGVLGEEVSPGRGGGKGLRATSIVSFVSSNLPAHLQSYPTTEQEARVAELQGMIAGFRKELDKMRFEGNRKESHLEALMQEVYERAQLDKFTEQSISSGESCIEELASQLDATAEDIGKEDHTNRFLMRVLDACHAFPARVEKHILLLEERLENMREDRLSLTKDLDEVVLFTKRTLEQEKPAMQEALRQRSAMHARVLARLESWRADDNARWLYSKARAEGRKALTQAIREQSFLPEEAHRNWHQLHRQLLFEHVLSMEDPDEAQRRRLRRLGRRLEKSAKSRDPATICAKMALHKTRRKELEHEAREAASRLQALQSELKAKQAEAVEARKARKQARASAAVAATTVLDQLSTSNAQAERRLHRAQGDLLDTHATIRVLQAGLCAIQERVRARLPDGADDYDWETRFAQPDSAALATGPAAPLSRLRTAFQTLLGALGRDGVVVPPSDARPTARPRRQGPLPLSKAQERQRRKFLFGAGVRKAPVALPPRLGPSS